MVRLAAGERKQAALHGRAAADRVLGVPGAVAGDGQVAADGQRAGHPAAGEGHVVVDLAAAQKQATWTETELFVNWPLTASEPPLIAVGAAVGVRAAQQEAAAAGTVEAEPNGSGRRS